jgi:beta-lactamase class A
MPSERARSVREPTLDPAFRAPQGAGAVRRLSIGWLVALACVAPLPAGAQAGATRAAPARPVADLAALRAALERIARASGGRLGVGIELLESGESLVVNGAHRHPMQSVYKLPIAMAALHAVDQGALRLDQPVEVRPADFISAAQHSPVRDAHPDGARLPLREVLRLAVAESDGTASDVLLRLLGGPARVTAYLRGLGVTELVVATTEQEMGRDEGAQYRSWATPRGCLAVLRLVHERRALSDTSRALLLQDLTDTRTGPRRLRGLLPPGTVVAHKTDSSRTIAGVGAATNDIGIVTLPDGRHLAVAVLLMDARAAWDTRERTIAEVGRAAWDAWTAPSR